MDGSGSKLVMLDNGSSSLGAYAMFSTQTGEVLRVLVYNSAFFSGSGSRSSEVVALAGLKTSATLRAKRLTAPASTSLAGQGITIGGSGTFDASCNAVGSQVFESVVVQSGTASVTLKASEAVILYVN